MSPRAPPSQAFATLRRFARPQQPVERCESRGLRQIVEVRMIVGELTCVEVDQLKFCFEAVTKDSTLENVTLEIEGADAAVRCPHCGYGGPPKYWDDAQVSVFFPTLECPDCGRAAEPTAGHECSIKSIKYKRESDASNPELSVA